MAFHFTSVALLHKTDDIYFIDFVSRCAFYSEHTFQINARDEVISVSVTSSSDTYP